MNKEFIKVRTKTDIAISTSLLVFGVVFSVLPALASVNVFGFFALPVGALLLAVLKSGWQDPQTGERYGKKERFFPEHCKAKILDALENRMQAPDIPEECRGGGLRMDIYFNRQSGKAFVSLFEYVPYHYESASPTFEYSVDEMEKFIG